MSRSRLESVLAAVALLLALWIVGTTIAVMRAGHEALPFWDEWDRWITWSRDHYTLTWFFEQHNEHRLAAPKLLFMADHLFFGARNWFLLWCTFCLQGVTGVMLWRYLARFRRPDRSEGIVLGAVIVSCLYSAQQEINFIWAFQVQFALVYCLATGSFLTLLKSEEQRRARGRGAVWIAATLALAAGATYSMANGVLVWPVLLLAAWWWRMPWPRIGAIADGALLLGAPFFYHWKGPEDPEVPMTLAVRVWRAALFVVTHAGAPVDAIASVTGSDLVRILCGGAVGVVLLIAALAGFNYVWRRRDPRLGAQAMLLHLCAFLVGTSSVIAFGRADISPTYAFASRYQTPAYLFWLCLLVASWPLLQLASRPGLYAKICLALALGIAVEQLHQLNVVAGREAKFHQKSAAVVAGVFDEDAWSEIYYEPEDALPVVPYLRNERLGLFAEEWTHWIGTPVAGRFRIADQTACRGEWREVSRIQSDKGPGWRAAGWAWDIKGGRATDFIVFVDDTGKIAGAGRNGVGNWLGYVAGAPGRVTAYVVESDQRSLCAVGTRDLR